MYPFSDALADSGRFRQGESSTVLAFKSIQRIYDKKTIGENKQKKHMANTLRHYVRYFVGKACHDSGSGYTSNMLLNMIEYDPSGLRCWYSCWSATPFARTPEASGVLWEMFPERDPAVIGCLAGGFPQRFLPLHHKHQQHAREADSTWHADGHMIRVKVCEGCITGCHLLTTYKGEFPC